MPRCPGRGTRWQGSGLVCSWLRLLLWPAAELIGEFGAQEISGFGLHAPQPEGLQLFIAQFATADDLDLLCVAGLLWSIIEDDPIRLLLPARAAGVVFRRLQHLAAGFGKIAIGLRLAPVGPSV